MTRSLPDYGPARPMETAPRDGTRILVLAEVASDEYTHAVNGPVIAVWGNKDWENGCPDGWCLWPHTPGTHLDGEPTGWFPLPEQTR